MSQVTLGLSIPVAQILVAPHIALDPRLDCFDPFTRALVACCKTSDIYSCVPASPFPSQANFSPFIAVGGPSHKFFVRKKATHCKTSDICSRKSTFLYICPLKHESSLFPPSSTSRVALGLSIPMAQILQLTLPWMPHSIASICSRGILDTCCKTSDICSGKSTFLYICPLTTRVLAVPTIFNAPGRFGAIHPHGRILVVAHITLIPSGLVHHALRRVYHPDVDLHVAPTVADVVTAAQSQFLSFAPESLLPPPPPSPSPLQVTLGLYTPHKPSTAPAAAPLIHKLRMKVATAHNATMTPPATTVTTMMTGPWLARFT
ncbi:hypothetical protein EDB84DRAFT_1567463 [Lactarius hengduanensis]|nr:hypothetical protein EDB84DRAFT_1567463 [Lactarius hengduanensis]